MVLDPSQSRSYSPHIPIPRSPLPHFKPTCAPSVVPYSLMFLRLGAMKTQVVMGKFKGYPIWPRPKKTELSRRGMVPMVFPTWSWIVFGLDKHHVWTNPLNNLRLNIQISTSKTCMVYICVYMYAYTHRYIHGYFICMYIYIYMCMYVYMHTSTMFSYHTIPPYHTIA